MLLLQVVLLLRIDKAIAKIMPSNLNRKAMYRGGHKSLYRVQLLLFELGKVTYGHPLIRCLHLFLHTSQSFHFKDELTCSTRLMLINISIFEAAYITKRQLFASRDNYNVTALVLTVLHVSK